MRAFYSLSKYFWLVPGLVAHSCVQFCQRFYCLCSLSVQPRVHVSPPSGCAVSLGKDNQDKEFTEIMRKIYSEPEFSIGQDFP